VILLPRDAADGSAAARLLAALARRGHAVESALPGPLPSGDLFLCPAPGEPASDLRRWLHEHPPAAATRLLVVTRLGTHRDARAGSLRSSWELEEAARGTGLPVLVLRIGPVVGPASPLWARLRSGPVLPRGGRKLLNPVAERDVVETLDRALSGRARWDGWHEVAGAEVWSLVELAGLARGMGPALPAGSGAWEPPLEEMEEHRLAEAEPWLEHFGMSVRPLGEQAREWTPAGAEVEA
jgi:uncharacterized protein YbjT (DUF2867 family)